MMIAKTATDCVTAKILSREWGKPIVSGEWGRSRQSLGVDADVRSACLPAWVRGLFLMPALGETADPSPGFAVNVLLKIRQ